MDMLSGSWAVVNLANSDWFLYSPWVRSGDGWEAPDARALWSFPAGGHLPVQHDRCSRADSSWPLFSMGRWLLKIGQLRANAWVQKEGCRG